MKNYGKVATTNGIILTTITVVLIGALVWAIPILQQNANANPVYVPYQTSPSDVNPNSPHDDPSVNHFAWGPSDVTSHTNHTR